MSDLVFVRPTPAGLTLEDRVRDLLLEIAASGATHGELQLTPSDARREVRGMTGQLHAAIVVRPGMNEHILEAGRRERLTREELQAERGERGERATMACSCASWELCLCEVATGDRAKNTQGKTTNQVLKCRAERGLS
jgi:hypothetical protein